MKFDGILFGNGMTLNLLNQLSANIPEEKKYLLDIDQFIRMWIDGSLSIREERILKSEFYGRNAKNNSRFYENLIHAAKRYYIEYDANIEYMLGDEFFKIGEEPTHEAIKCAWPVLYNIWYDVLQEYLVHLGLKDNINAFYYSVLQTLGRPQYVWTTNLDLFAESIKPQHLHGYFVENMKNFYDAKYRTYNKSGGFYFKYIWGCNGQGKLELINNLKHYNDYKNYFDFDFFFDDSFTLNTLLIYGLGFCRSGYMPRLEGANPKYKKPSIGGIIDEHILWRIKALQDLGRLNKIVVICSENEMSYMKQVMESQNIIKFQIVNYNDFSFSTSREKK